METTTVHAVKEIDWSPKTFIIKKDKLPISQLSQFFGPAYGALYGALGKMGINSAHPPLAFYYDIDENNNIADLAAAVEVDQPDIEVPGFEKLTIPASKLITTRHTGSYDTMGPAYEALEQFLSEKGLKKELMIEQYLSDPMAQKDPSKWQTDIFFIVK
jgi:effector-binding domain-containing protein